ncbi:TPA: ABC transporter ATP-binding protein [Bacillus cereus]|uniref:ABC transporter ATP-binding protein n=1 Tax=Bacillus cereus TaxID=1396 RepID=UPI000789F67F|nr:antibiotic ABC transporter ATP-binding protein [Bacillus cereus]MBL3853229.1 ABC transporter ATP-binding protein [Bacillus cereus]HEF5066340.1 ABC transporter ATP-binding protein [Bacillus cereus]HEF7299021.1 ABC transporter ATP-binding protein [Bacillus cereus]
MNNVVIIKELYKKFDNEYILNNINLELEEGKIYGVVGRNGSGKSILFKTISGLISPNKGQLIVFGESIGKGKFPKNLGLLLDIPGFLPSYSGFKNLKLLASINNKLSDAEIKEYIHLVGLDPNDSKPVKKYSLGMKQRLGIAQAIMEKPKLLILDEPMNGLDEQGIHEIRNLLKKQKNQGVTILLSSHNSEDIQVLCDKVYKMDSGKIQLSESI